MYQNMHWDINHSHKHITTSRKKLKRQTTYRKFTRKQALSPIPWYGWWRICTCVLILGGLPITDWTLLIKDGTCIPAYRVTCNVVTYGFGSGGGLGVRYTVCHSRNEQPYNTLNVTHSNNIQSSFATLLRFKRQHINHKVHILSIRSVSKI
jgi:hypothetical protein